MPNIKIPKSAHKPLLELARMEDERFEELLSAIANAAPKLSQVEFAKSIVASATSLDRATVMPLVNEFFNFDYVRAGTEASQKEIASLIASTAFAARSEDFAITEQDKSVIENRVEKILSVRKAMSLTAKTINVMSDQERVFIKSRVLTDFRPVFSEDAESIDAGVIVHTLTIHFAQDNDHKDFYVAMDTADIQKLRDVLDRADKKAKLLSSLFKESKVSYISAT